MNRMFRAGLLALPFLVAGQSAAANEREGVMGTRWGAYQYGCKGFCLNLFPHINQHGPLVNYGPYEGYYPFAPYGPWNSDLSYNGGAACGWNGRACGRHGCGRCGGGAFDRLHGLFHRDRGCDSGNCGGWGGYARSVFKNVGHRCSPFAHGKPACSTCAH